MASKGRTWTLVDCQGPLSIDIHADGPDLDPSEGEGVRVIELEPVLDLLERLISVVGIDETVDEAEAMLRSHGRLESPRGE